MQSDEFDQASSQYISWLEANDLKPIQYRMQALQTAHALKLVQGFDVGIFVEKWEALVANQALAYKVLNELVKCGILKSEFGEFEKSFIYTWKPTNS